MHMKNAEKRNACKDRIVSSARIESFLSLHASCSLAFFACVCIAYLGFLIGVANFRALCNDKLETGLYTAAVRDQYCGRAQGGGGEYVDRMQYIMYSQVSGLELGNQHKFSEFWILSLAEYSQYHAVVVSI